MTNVLSTRVAAVLSAAAAAAVVGFAGAAHAAPSYTNSQAGMHGDPAAAAQEAWNLLGDRPIQQIHVCRATGMPDRSTPPPAEPATTTWWCCWGTTESRPEHSTAIST